MTLYKLTEQDGTTYHRSMMWEVGKTNKVRKCEDPKLCSRHVIHAYQNANLALLLNPMHASIRDPLLFKCEGDIVIREWDKCGVFALTPVQQLPYPIWYPDPELRSYVAIMFAILCASRIISCCESAHPRADLIRAAIEAASAWLVLKTHDAAWAAVSAAVRVAAICAPSGVRRTAYAAVRMVDASMRAAIPAASAIGAAEWAARVANDTIDFCALADEAVRLIMSGDYKTWWWIGGVR